ncbi:MAG TPA: FAD-dependent oxidoreductase [Acidimicrobiales bacterium]|nr:FAD-dependent oxidoreductase [Acidimicrobiales bacterium]
MRNNIAIVGAGLVGARLAEELRAIGHEGRLVLVGAESHAPYDRPPLSKEMLAGRDLAPGISLLDAEKLQTLGVEWHPGVAATALDTSRRVVELADKSSISFDRLAIATGASPLYLPDTEHLRSVHVLRTLDDCLRLRKSLHHAAHVTVVGGGVLGCEIAATISGEAHHVTLVEAGDSLLGRVVPQGEFSNLIQRIHESSGVQVMLGRSVDRIDGSESAQEVVLSDGSTIATNLIVMAIGVRPSTDWLAGSDLELDDGVLCDEHLETNVSGIFAAGDIARLRKKGSCATVRYEHWTAAVQHAQIVAHNLIADDTGLQVSEDESYVWSDQFGRRLQILGRVESGRQDEVVEHIAMRDDVHNRMLALYADPGGAVLGITAIGAAKAFNALREMFRSPLSLRDAIARIS